MSCRFLLANIDIGVNIRRILKRKIDMDEIAELVDSIPDDEWWHMSTRETFINVAGTLLEAGFELGDIQAILSDLYVAVANEFGG